MQQQNKHRTIGFLTVLFIIGFIGGLTNPIKHISDHFKRNQVAITESTKEADENYAMLEDNTVYWEDDEQYIEDGQPKPVIFEGNQAYAIVKVASKDTNGKKIIKKVKRNINKPKGRYKRKGDPDFDKYAYGMDSEVYCLARAMYYEARGEGPIGQRAVGNVILNRVAYKHYFPNTVCGVIAEKGQFQWYHNASLRGKVPFKVNVHTDIVDNARQLMTEHRRGTRVDTTQSSFFFSANGVRPAPSAVYHKHVGKHAFYKLSLKWHKQQVAMKG